MPASVAVAVAARIRLRLMRVCGSGHAAVLEVKYTSSSDLIVVISFPYFVT